MEVLQKIFKMISENQDTLALIVAVVTFLQNYFSKRDAKLENKQDKYLEILIQYFEKKEIYPDTIDSLNYFKNLKNKETCIPPYIFYAAENKTKEELDKILMVDYWRENPSIDNNTIRSLNRFLKYIYYLAYIILVIILVMYSINILIEFEKDITTKGVGAFIAFFKFAVSIILEIIFCKSIIKTCKKISLDIDMYSFKMKNINAQINEKIEYYNKNINKYYI
ncbi:MAG: hypothetical protein ACLR8H_05655 [Clostridium sp.]